GDGDGLDRGSGARDGEARDEAPREVGGGLGPEDQIVLARIDRQREEAIVVGDGGAAAELQIDRRELVLEVRGRCRWGRLEQHADPEGGGAERRRRRSLEDTALRELKGDAAERG